MDQINWLDHYIPTDQVPGLFRNADLVVLPYQNATQSGVVPVAYQFDVPVIATRVGGLSEVIQDNATGFLVPPGNAIALAEKILEYFETSRKLEFQNNIRSFRERLSWSQAAENLVELVTELKGSDSL
jgi:glycosyltransferase involved in cell wall biosynthesis